MSEFKEFATSFPITVIGMVVLIREALWAHPDSTFLLRKLNNITFQWHHAYTKDDLMRQTHNLLREWANAHGCRIKDISIAAHQRYWIQSDGWIVRRPNWRPYDEFQEVK